MFEELIGRRARLASEERRRSYAVLVPWLQEEQSLLFEVRADTLQHQPGEISFPGGRVERGERRSAAAVRESCEELLVEASQITLVAPLDIQTHMSGALVYPYLGQLAGYQGTFSPAEVKEVFTVPFSWFMETEPQVYVNEVSVVRADEHFPYELVGNGGVPYPWGASRHHVLFYTYGGHIIWGLTARITRNLVELHREALAAPPP